MRLRHLAAITLLSAASRAPAQDLNLITAVTVKDEGATVVMTVVGSKPPNFTTFSMADPPRFVVDLSEAKFKGVPEDMSLNNGTILSVKNLSYGADQSAIARVMVAFNVDVDPPDVEAQGTALVVRIQKPGAAGMAVAAAGGADDAKAKAEAQKKADEAQKKADLEAKAKADAERRAEAEASARAAAEQEQADQKAREEADAKAQADAKAKAKADEAAAAAAAVAAATAAAETSAKEAEAPKAEQPAAAPEAPAATPEEAPAATAAAAAEDKKEDKKKAEAEARAEARRQREEAVAAAKAEQEAKKREAADRKAEAKRQREEALAASAPSQVRELGFKQLPTASRVFVRTSTTPHFTIQDAGENLIRVEVENARASRHNDMRFLDTSFFPSAVAMITPVHRGSSYVLEIKLKQKVPYQQKIEGDMLAIDFERPAGSQPPAPDVAQPGTHAPGAEPAAVDEPASEPAASPAGEGGASPEGEGR